MPRPKVPGAPEPKRRSRTGCWTCKAKKVKCGEEKPKCVNCVKNNEPVCDYSIRLNWEGRSKRKADETTPEPSAPSPTGMAAGMRTISFQSPTSAPTTAPLPRMNEHTEASSPLDPALVLAGLPHSARDFSSPSMHHIHNGGSRPSSSHSRYDGGSSSAPNSATFHPGRMPPPFNANTPLSMGSPGERTSSMVEHRDKRARASPTSASHYNSYSGDYLSPRNQAFTPTSVNDSFVQSRSGLDTGRVTPSGTPSSASNHAPSPPASYVKSEDIPTSLLIRSSPYLYDDVRRLSVNSLLTQEEEIKKTEGEHRDSKASLVTFGMDRGLPDLDIPKNDDSRALEVVTPPQELSGFSNDFTELSSEFGFGIQSSNSSSKLAGYSKPIPVTLHKSLLPLPSLLLDNPMNLMYFHFFQEFTARILVPHDCPDNPFIKILPQMAVRDDNLLHLLLAYSASHRARLLKQPEPSNRIALWVKDVFPNLRKALNDDAGRISNANLATAIMLASLEIIAPNAFDVPVPWQDHLAIARGMIIARGGPRSVNRHKDRVSYFLIRWFAYLDVVGNFSSTGARADQAMFSGDLYDFEDKDDFQIDCILGYSGRLASLLAKTADLARRCENERIDASGNIDESWQPPLETVESAKIIRSELLATRNMRCKLCPHRQPGAEFDVAWEAMEMSATNEAFLWACLIHLHRRVLAVPQDSEDVQVAVREVVGTLYKVRKGGPAEACLLWPLITAGCEAREPSQREIILERLRSVEESGMTQVHKARKLIELVWETGRPWETLVQGEFFG